MLASEKDFEAQVGQVAGQLAQVAEGLGADGLLVAASICSGGVHAIRSLWTQLAALRAQLQATPVPSAQAPGEAEAGRPHAPTE